MKIAVLGTGAVGQTVAEKLASLGHQVTIGTRNPDETLAKTASDAFGNPPIAVWLQQHSDVLVGAFDEAARQADVLFNCTKGDASVAVLTRAGADNLNGKLLVDISNPLDFSRGFPPFLSISNTHSLAEEIQNAFPGLRVVKTLNTMTAAIMVNPNLLQGDHSVFVSGNDAAAKTQTTDLLKSFGWATHNIIDLGDLSTARGTEMLLPAWVRLYGALQSPLFNFHINRTPANP